MNARFGTIRLVYEDALYTLGKMLFVFITIPLMIVWILIGFVFSIGDDVVAAISGPAYFFIPFFAVAGFRSLLPVAVAFGSTRVQLLKVFQATGVAAVAVSILVLNILQYMLLTVYETWIGPVNILHPGQFVFEKYHFISYLWIDLMAGLFLFALGFLMYSLVYRLGFKRSVIVFVSVAIIGMFLYYGGVLDSSSFEWIWRHDLHPLTSFTIVGLLSLGALFVTYPLLKNAPLNKSMYTVR